jgi:hypothetical protein
MNESRKFPDFSNVLTVKFKIDYTFLYIQGIEQLNPTFYSTVHPLRCHVR